MGYASKWGLHGDRRLLRRRPDDQPIQCPGYPHESCSIYPNALRRPYAGQNAVLKLTGTLTSNVQITLPLPGYYVIDSSGLAAAGIANWVQCHLTSRWIWFDFVSARNARHVYNEGKPMFIM